VASGAFPVQVPSTHIATDEVMRAKA